MTFKKYLSVIFLFVLFIPFIDKVFNISDTVFKYKNNEKRTLGKMPDVDINYLDGFPKLYEQYVNDHFMLRSFLIDQYNNMCVKLFKQSPVPNKAYIGIDDWLYLNNYEYNISHKVELSEQQLKNFVEELKRRRDFLKQQNCSLYVYIVPPKIKVYPEYGGRRVPNEPDQGASLEAYAKKNSDLPITYLLPTFLNKKKEGTPLLYYKTDNHWSNYGGFIAYAKIMADLKKDFPMLKSLTFNDLLVKDDTADGGNTAQMMGVESYFKEYHHRLEVKKRQSTEVERKGYSFVGDFDKNEFEKQYNHENKALPSVLFIRDSFGGALIPYLSESFSHSTFIFDVWRYQSNEEIILSEKPSAVVYIIYEPLLLNLLDHSKKALIKNHRR